MLPTSPSHHLGAPSQLYLCEKTGMCQFKYFPFFKLNVYPFSVPIYNAQLQPAPTVPPENCVTDQDRQVQQNYEHWLQTQTTSLTNQQQFYETEVKKLRKNRKSLNSKRLVLRKSGNELSPQDSADLARITSQQTAVQKQLESSRKQARQHGLVVQDYKSKHQPKPISSVATHPVASPVGQMAPQSPLMSPSPSSQQSMMAVQSPLNNNPLMQPNRSPLHSPSPLMSQSPGPGSVNSIMQSPGPQGQSSMSPFSSMQPSPRIGTPHSQHNDENPFSPSGGK